MNVVCYERGLLWTGLLWTRSVMNAVCYEEACYERGLFWMVCYDWSVMNRSVLNGHRSTQRSPVHREEMQGTSNRDIHLYPLHNNWSVHLTKITNAINRLQTGVGRFRSCLHKWSMATSANCECGAENQTVNRVFFQCPIHRPPHGLHGFGWRDNRFAAQHQPLDLARPSSGLKELTQMMMKELVLAFCRQTHLSQPRCAVVFMCWIN